jgi:hypothetical protein
VLVRILLWNLFDSRTSIEELRTALPDVDPPGTWLWNEAGERFGLVVFGEDLPEAVGWAADLVGGEPDVYEEFDAL